MTEARAHKTKRKVDLVSSHSENENGSLAAYSTEGSAVSVSID